jgi:hypothetical protein
MGLPRESIKLIAETVAAMRLRGRALLIGKQEVYGSENQVKRWIEESGLRPAAACVRLSRIAQAERTFQVEDKSVFELMGFAEVANLDVSDYEGAEVIHDLNRPLPDTLADHRERYQLLVDAGNSEHIFELPQVLRNYHALLAPDGVVIHILPSTNSVDHGFYMFSPTLFHDYYTANRWRLRAEYFVRHGSPWSRSRVWTYRPGAFEKGGGPIFGGAAQYSIFVAAQKEGGATCDADVQQSYYARQWTDAAPPAADRGWRGAVKNALPPFALSILRGLRDEVRYRRRAWGGAGRYLSGYRKL